MNIKRICWLASYPKSGSTWIRLLLSHYHSGIADINDIRGVSGDKGSYFWHAVSYQDMSDMTPHEIACLRPAALCHQLAANPSDPLPVKTHHWNATVDEIPLIPPGVTKGAVYIVRDPRDVVLSVASYYELSIDKAIDMMADESRKPKDPILGHYTSSWSNHVRSWLANDVPWPMACVQYEHLSEHPVDTFAGILHFMGYDLDMDKVREAVNACSLDKCRAQEKENPFKENMSKNPFFGSGGSRWRDVLTDKQVRRIESDHGLAMKGLGYLSEAEEAA